MRSEFKIPDCSDCVNRLSSYFNNLSTVDLRDLNKEKACNLYKKNQNIFYEGTSSNGLYCLNSGKIKLFKKDITGKEHIVRFIAPGGFFGIKAFIESTNFSATSTAIEDSVVCFINKDQINHLMRIYPNFSNYMLIKLSKMLKNAERKIASIALKSVRERTAESLLLLANTYNPGQNIFEIKISRDDLAKTVGSATENVIRVLSEFKEEKLISISGKSLIILNFPKLEQAGNLVH